MNLQSDPHSLAVMKFGIGQPVPRTEDTSLVRGKGCYTDDDGHKRLRLIHCPVHSSWLNQIEIYNSIIQRKVLTPNDFVNLDEVERRLLQFERRYEAAATPFEWKFTRQDLRALMARLEEKELPYAA